MSRAWPLILLVFLLPAAALSDSSNLEGGVFIAHHPPGLQYSEYENWCARYFQDFAIDSCSEQNNRIDTQEDLTVWFVLAAWSEPKEWRGVEFGLAAYDSTICALTSWGPCYPAGGGLEIPTAGWPGPNDGTSLTATGAPWSGNFLPVYYFVSYAYYAGEIPLGVNPVSGFGGTANCDSLPQTWAASAFGSMGLLQDGVSACPDELDQGEGGLYGGEGGSEQEDDSTGGFLDASYIPPINPSAIVSVYIDPSAISFGDRSSAKSVAMIDSSSSALKDGLISVDVRTLVPAFPQASLADTIGYDTNGRPVQLPDVSSFFDLEFDDPAAAVRAIPILRSTPGIRHAEVRSADPLLLTFPNDPYFEDWPDNSAFAQDAQWNLQNDGAHPGQGQCSQAVSGADIGAQGGWSRGLGDSTTVIGIVDTGVLGGIENMSCHEDLRVVPLSLEERRLISAHPDSDWCATHGTRMAGTAAARTNNAVGLAGICGDCSILDIESAACCYSKETDVCGDLIMSFGPHNWRANILGALGLQLQPQVLRVLNLSFGREDRWLEMDAITCLWHAFARNVVVVTSAGNTNARWPRTHLPANVPFVLGVGGATWDGLWWDASTTCYPDTNGTTIGHSDTTAIGGASGRICDVCAPASGPYVVTEPFVRVGASGYYWYSKGKGSGASAQGAGTAGLIQSLAHERYGADISADDVVGIIETTATPWPSGNEHPMHYADCSSCSLDYFGNGIINVAHAASLITDYGDCWRHDNDPDYCERVAGKHGAIVPGTWTFALVDSGLGAGDTMWVEYKATATVSVAQPGPPPLRGALPRIGWVRRKSENTNTCSSYSPDMSTRVAMMRDGMTDCRMGVIDQETGNATISGYTYAFRYPRDTGALVHLVPEDSVRMAYVVMCDCYPTSIEDGTVPDAGPDLMLTGHTCQSRSQVNLSIIAQKSGTIEMGVYDVSGRCIRVFDLGKRERGKHQFTWDGKGAHGDRIAAGVYWFRVTMDGVARAKRCVLLGR